MIEYLNKIIFDAINDEDIIFSKHSGDFSSYYVAYTDKNKTCFEVSKDQEDIEDFIKKLEEKKKLLNNKGRIIFNNFYQ